MKKKLIKFSTIVACSLSMVALLSTTSCRKNKGNGDIPSESSSQVPVEAYTYTDNTKSAIYYGSYPQSKVSDSSLLDTLNTAAGDLPTSDNKQKWTSYGYYSGSAVSDLMFYIDLDQDNDGAYDYRGVYIANYRPYNTMYGPQSSNVKNNGYSTNSVYWFKYEPVKWNILDTENGKAFIVSDLLIDSQDYNHTSSSRAGSTDYQNNSTADNVSPNNYMYSSIREWLNVSFYNTAFNQLQKDIIDLTRVDNSGTTPVIESNNYACENTSDNLFLLSIYEAQTYYSSNSARIAKGTDYAKCQGLWTSNENGCYMLRKPESSNEKLSMQITEEGYIASNTSKWVIETTTGVRPACWIKL